MSNARTLGATPARAGASDRMQPEGTASPGGVHTVGADPSGATHTVRGACPHDCPDTCALLVTVEAGRATRVQGDPEHPTTHGALCTKVSRYTERSYHPERVLHAAEARRAQGAAASSSRWAGTRRWTTSRRG